MFVGAAGSPYAAFRRAIEARNLTRAITEARDLPQISLEERNVTLGEAQLVLAGLAGLRGADRQSAALALIAVFTARERRDLDRPFRRLLGNATGRGHH
jgi:hypothetical protein